jgi:hypothetical protein
MEPPASQSERDLFRTRTADAVSVKGRPSKLSAAQRAEAPPTVIAADESLAGVVTRASSFAREIGPRDGIVRDRKLRFDLLEIGGPFVLGVVYTHEGEKRLQRSQRDHRQQDWRSERWGKSRRGG